MSDTIRAAATLLAVSSAALMQAELNRNASATRQSRRRTSPASGNCPVLSADGHALGTLKTVVAQDGHAGSLVVRAAGRARALPREFRVSADAAFDRHGRIVLPVTAADLVDAACRIGP